MALILFFLPFSFRLSSIAIGLLFCYTIISIFLQKRSLSFYKRQYFWLPLVLVIISLIGLIYTSNIRSGIGVVETQISLFFFAFIFSELDFSKSELTKLKMFYISFFLVLVFVLEFRVLWLLMISTEHSFLEYFFSYYYTYSNLTTQHVIQPVYIGTFVILSNIFCLTFIAESRGVRNKLLLLIIIIINTFFLFQLSARSSILLNLLVILVFILHIFYQKRMLFRGVLLGIMVLLLSAFLFLSSGFTRLRMLGFLSEISADDIRVTDPTSRVLMWSCAIEIIQDNMVFGVGTGDSEDVLKSKYKEHGLIELFVGGFNAHNQYLTLIMRHGILFFGVYIYSIMIMAYKFYKTRRIEELLFMILVLGFFLTENVLSRAQGVIFFGFFLCAFLSVANKNTEDENTCIRN